MGLGGRRVVVVGGGRGGGGGFRVAGGAGGLGVVRGRGVVLGGGGGRGGRRVVHGQGVVGRAGSRTLLTRSQDKAKQLIRVTEKYVKILLNQNLCITPKTHTGKLLDPVRIWRCLASF